MHADQSRRSACGERHIQTERVCLETCFPPSGSILNHPWDRWSCHFRVAPVLSARLPLTNTCAHKKKNFHQHYTKKHTSKSLSIIVKLSFWSRPLFLYSSTFFTLFQQKFGGMEGHSALTANNITGGPWKLHILSTEKQSFCWRTLQYFWIQYWFRNCQPAFWSQLIVPDLVGRLCYREGLCFLYLSAKINLRSLIIQNLIRCVLSRTQLQA